MERYIARQPIFNEKIRVVAYELLYRGNAPSFHAVIGDGDQATRSLLSDAITVFGVKNLTNAKPAFINFTENLILDDFVQLANPEEVSIELLETIKITPALIEKLKQLKELGYQLILDDYVGDPYFDSIIPLMNIIKVDFLDTDTAMQESIAEWFQGSDVTLLAEKVESKEIFDWAAKIGYSLFQGYFFEKPMVLQRHSSALATSSYARIFRELNMNEVDLRRCRQIIRSDATMTYQLFQQVRTLRYYRGNSIQNIQQALMLMGTDELRRWIVLLLAREHNVAYSDELVRNAYLRAIFLERLIEHSFMPHRSSDGFLLGMFSMLEKIMGLPLEKILTDIPIAQDIANTLLRKEENVFSPFLEFLLIYEMKNPALMLPPLRITLEPDQIAALYMQCMAAADKAFNN